MRKRQVTAGQASASGEVEDVDDDEYDPATAESSEEPVRKKTKTKGVPKGVGKAPQPFENGVVTSLVLENFMNHEHMRVDLDPHVNFIIGKNGSGKSAIVAGLLSARPRPPSEASPSGCPPLFGLRPTSLSALLPRDHRASRLPALPALLLPVLRFSLFLETPFNLPLTVCRLSLPPLRSLGFLSLPLKLLHLALRVLRSLAQLFFSLGCQCLLALPLDALRLLPVLLSQALLQVLGHLGCGPAVVLLGSLPFLVLSW